MALRIRLKGRAVDFEHDRAYALWLPLIGVQVDSVYHGMVDFMGWIHPNSLDDFRVPPAGYDPVGHPETVTCTQCDEPHPIIPEGFYTPPTNEALYERVRGQKVKICLWVDDGG
jgi:hypothetical protein